MESTSDSAWDNGATSTCDASTAMTSEPSTAGCVVTTNKALLHFVGPAGMAPAIHRPTGKLEKTGIAEGTRMVHA